MLGKITPLKTNKVPEIRPLGKESWLQTYHFHCSAISFQDTCQQISAHNAPTNGFSSIFPWGRTSKCSIDLPKKGALGTPQKIELRGFGWNLLRVAGCPRPCQHNQSQDPCWPWWLELSQWPAWRVKHNELGWSGWFPTTGAGAEVSSAWGGNKPWGFLGNEATSKEGLKK